MTAHPEITEIRNRYARRGVEYDTLLPWMARIRAEREMAYSRILRRTGVSPAQSRLLEIGCGAGQNLLYFLQVGFRPENVVGNELLEQRRAEARQRLPVDLEIIGGDASQLCSSQLGQFQVVAQHLVFSSILDRTFRQSLARALWDLVAPGGIVLWYDLRVNNPRNPDVLKVSRREIQALFPGGKFHGRRITLAPPIARAVCAVSDHLYPIFSGVPMLRSHIVGWVQK